MIQKMIVLETDIIPRRGDKIDMFYTPCPTVSDVILFPTEETLKRIDEEDKIGQLQYMFIKAIVFID